MYDGSDVDDPSVKTKATFNKIFNGLKELRRLDMPEPSITNLDRSKPFEIQMSITLATKM